MNAAYYMGNKTIKMGISESAAPGPDEVRIRVAFSGICGTDLHIYQGEMDKRVKIPHVPGHECSGIVVETGENVRHVSISDKVVVRPLGYCGKCEGCQNGLSHICYNMNFLGADSNGCMQEFWTVPAHTVHKIPDGMSLELAALVEPLAVACHDVARSGVKFGETALVIGGGPIGALIAIVAREAGACIVVAEVNESRAALLKQLGFDVVNPRKEDLAQKVFSMTNGYGADVVFEVSGSEQGVAAMTSVAKARGKIVQVSIIPHPMMIDVNRVFLRELEIFGARLYEHKDFEKAISLAASGKLPLEKLISGVVPLSELGTILDDLVTGKDATAMKVLVKCSE